MSVCPSCGREAPDGARFCAFCGQALEAPAPREERKVISVVFVDLVGHTARSESADPEDVRAILAPYHARARTELERFGGTVEKFIGDAVMAVFGAPTAHEDDAERAVRAALAVRDAFVEEGLDLRVAVNTGEALVDLAARGEAGEAMVAGDVVNTAARLQSAAPVNGVLVGEATYLATSRAIEYRDAPPVEAKGKSAPVGCRLAVAPRARYGIDVAQHEGSVLVGRDAERRLLVDAVDRAARERAVQLITLAGVPGMGKSRLVWELFQELSERTGLVATWRQGRALAYGGGPFGAVAEVVRAEAGVLETDDAATARSRLGAALAALVDDEAERAWLQGLLLPLVVPDAPHGGSREESFAAWQRFFERVAEHLPLVLVFEDLHWADDGTLDFVEHLVDWSADSPLLVVCTTRPELLERRPTWGGGRLNSQTISLAPLDDTSTAQLLANVLGTPLVDAEAQQTLLAQAGGNPLYAEEFARMVAETGGGGVPPTVQGVIAARLDVLSPAEKAVLQDAAVLGKVFWRGGVTALGADATDEILLALTRKEFVRRVRTSSVAGDSELAFRHALVRDVAYGQIPRAARAEKHRLAAEWIAATSSARPDLVAHHYLEALALTEAAGGSADPLREPARRALVAAGDRAAALGAHDEAARSFRRALELGGDDVAILLRYAAAAYVDDGSGLAEAERARDLAVAAGDASRAAEAEVAVARAVWLAADGPAAVAAIERGIETARRAGAREVLAEALEEQARILMTSGRSEEAVAASRQAIALADELGLDAISLQATITLGTAIADLGDAPLTILQAAADRADEQSNPRGLLRALNNAIFVLWNRGELQAARERHALAVSRLARFPLATVSAWLLAGDAGGLVESGEWERALAAMDEYRRALRGRPYYLDADVESLRAFVGFARGEPAALVALEAAIDPLATVQDMQVDLPARYVLAFAYRLLGRTSDADAIALRLAAIPIHERSHIARQGALAGVVSVLTGRDLIEGVEGASRWIAANRALVEGRFEDAHETLVAMGARLSAALTCFAAAERRGEAGEDTEPWASLAAGFFEEVGAVRLLRELEALGATRRSA